MAENLPAGVEGSSGSGRRDNFWLVIVVGLVIVTIVSIVVGSFVAKRFLGPRAGASDDAKLSPEEEETIARIDKAIENGKAKKAGAVEGKIGKSAKENEPVEKTEKTTASATMVTIEKDKKKDSVSGTKKEPKREDKPGAAAGSSEKYIQEEKTKDELIDDKKAETKRTSPETKPADNEREPSEQKPAAGEKNAGQGTVLYVLQLGVYSSRENAEHMKKTLEQEYNLPVYISEDKYDGVVRYRLQVGAFRDKENAQKLGRELQMKGYTYYISTKPAGD